MSIAEHSNQSDLQWRKRKMCNSEDIDDVLAQKQGRLHLAKPIYITLAKESPPRPSIADDSEDSTYDSCLHGRETDVCRDTSDTDSYSTDGIATMEVLEYELASTSDSADMFSHDTSSGTDDFVVAAAEMARAIFIGTSTTNNTSIADEDRLGYKVSSDDKFELLADTEESDAPTDPELGRADYWTCVKCKNRQNNPMYRYCEKCYQIRKSHFPPRPQQRKSRSNGTVRHRHQSSSNSRSNLGSASTNGSTSSSSDDEKDQHRQQHRRRPRHHHRPNGNAVSLSMGSGSSSLGIATDPDNAASPPSKRAYDGKLHKTNTNNHHHHNQVTGRFYGTTIGRNVAVNSVAVHSAGESSAASEDIELEPATTAPKSMVVASAHSSSTCSGGLVPAPQTVNAKLQNKFFKNVIDTMPRQGKIQPPTQLTLADSGRGSCSSSQELSPDRPTCSSQETFCSEIEEATSAVDGNEPPNDAAAVKDTLSLCSTISLASTCTTADVRSESSCSERLPESMDINIAEVQSRHSVCATTATGCSDVDAAGSGDDNDTVGSLSKKTKIIECSDRVADDGKLPVGALAMASLSSPSALGQPLEPGTADNSYGSCMMCLTQPKNGVFVHSRFLHVCCCYQCAVKVWNKRKRCPICNCKVKNVMKLFLH